MNPTTAHENFYWDDNFNLKDENRFLTTQYFWDCECEDWYIHPMEVKACSRCGAQQEDRPNSRTNEVLSLLARIMEKLNNEVESAL